MCCRKLRHFLWVGSCVQFDWLCFQHLSSPDCFPNLYQAALSAKYFYFWVEILCTNKKRNSMKQFAAMFDMDGVIIDSNPFHKISLEIFCKKYGFTFTEEDLRTKLFGRRNAEWIPLIFGDLTEEEIEKYSYEKEALFREVYKDDIVPLEGLVEFLKALETAGIPRAVATSAPPENVDFTLKMTYLEELFGVKLNSTHVTEGKPHPEIYLKTAEAMGYAPADTVVFEDSLAGVESGKRAGAKVVGIASTHTAEELHQADLVVPDFTHLTVEKVAALFD